MPGVPDMKPEQTEPPTQNSLENQENAISQPRQPQNLQGLLRFAMEAQELAGGSGDHPAATHSTPQPLDPEQQQFLHTALQSMTIDVISLMQKNIANLQEITKHKNLTDEEVDEKVRVFENILDYVDNIDVANDFHKINGFSIFEPCLTCTRPEIRVNVCDLIAVLSQNNPYIQDVICECTSVMPMLLKVLEDDESEEVKVKAMYAISCIARESDVGYKNLKQYRGLEVVKGALEKCGDKVRTKAAFLLHALINMDEQLIGNLLSMGFLEVINKGLQGEPTCSHEHLLGLLCLLLDGAKSTDEEVLRVKPDIQKTVEDVQKFVEGKEEFQEQYDYCVHVQRILHIKNK